MKKRRVEVLKCKSIKRREVEWPGKVAGLWTHQRINTYGTYSTIASTERGTRELSNKAIFKT